MKEKSRDHMEELLRKQGRNSGWRKLMMVLACVVVFFTTYALILPALTMEKNAYCGIKEHTHSASCYEQKLICEKEEGRKEGHAHTEQCYETERTLICQTPECEGHTHTEECRKTEQILTCDQEENEEHAHTESCYTEQTEVICGMEEQEGHVHTEACYQVETKLICGTEECAATEHKHDKDCYEKKMVCKKEEHQHNADCYADHQADTESAGVWEKTIPSALSGDWRKDVTAVAESQLGYRESTQNYQVTESGETKGYTRYGAWYGDPYGDWCAMFVSFCLHYAEIPSSAVPYEAGCQRWIAALQQKGIYEAAGGTYEPRQGDLIFFDWEGDGVSDHVGLVKAISGGGGYITTIEGNCSECVQTQQYAAGSPQIMGYGVLPDNPARQAQDETAQTDSETAEPEGTEKETEKEEQARRSPAAYMDPGMARGETDFGEYIVGIEVKKDGQTIEPGSSIEGKGNLSFNIAYTLPGGVLNPEDPTIIYDLPPQFKEIIGSSGNLGDDRGTYVITPEGKIMITFSEEYVEKNQGGQHINGYISFDCDASRLEHGEDGKVSLDFNDKVKIELTVTDPTEGTEDLKVSKSGGEKWDEKGTVEYTVRITSKHGTQGPVKLKDIMTDIDLVPDSIQVINGPDGVSITPDGDGFDMTLPPLGENGTYEIKYQAKAEQIPGGVQTKNHVQVESTDKDGGKLEGSADTNLSVKPNCIGKSGEQDGDKIKWTVTVNADKLNIGGWTLSDELNGEKFEGEVVITGEDGKQVTAALPYQFPNGANGTYIVTYETTVEAEPGDWTQEKNKATITDKKGNSDSAEVEKWIQYKPAEVTKSGTGVSAGIQDGELVTNWNVNIAAKEGELKAPWYYQDRLEGNNQWYTQEQMDAIQAAVQEAAAGKNLTCTFTSIQENGRYVGFRIDFETALKKGETIAFAYQGTADAGNGSGGMTLKNKGSVNDKFNDWGENTVDRLIEKYDLSDNSSWDSSHEVTEEHALLEWGIRIKPPKGYNGGMLVVTEHLPAGVELASLDIEVKPFSGKQDIVFNGTTGTADCHGYTVEAIQNERDIIIRIPEGLAAEDTLEEILLGVHANISDDCEWTASENAANVATFPNRVEITSQDGKTSGEDSQTQHVTKKDHVKDGVILKNHGEVHDNYVPYTIVVNPNGEDLAEGTDTLHLTDTLEFPTWVAANAAVKPNSVQLYERNPDGSKGAKLPPSDYSYQLETGEGTTKFAKIYLTIPDEKALIVEYEYKIVGDKNTWVPITNSAVLDGITSSDGQNKTDYAFSITESQAGAVIAGVDIYKVDKSDNSLFLEGAKFKLHRWDGQKGEYVLCDEMGVAITDDRDGIMMTDKNGRLPIELAYNTAYYLEEIEAPKGYMKDKELYYFYMWSADEEKYPSCKPEDFTGKKHVVGDVIYYPNEKDQAAVEVEKQWFRPDGTECTGQKAGSISFELWRRAEQEDVGESGTVTIRTEGGIWNTPIVENYPLGTKVHYCISYKWYEWNHGSITVNGTEIPGPAVTGGAQTATYDFTVTVEADTQVLVTLYDANSDGWECHAAGTEYPVKVVGEEKLGTYHISSENGWKWSMADVKDQEFTQTGTDAQGDPLHYKYFVKEVRSTNATVAYENNGGITEGTITVKNTESDSPSYELPSTGGSGTLLHTFSGLALMGGALIYEIKRRMRKQRSENVSSFSM